LGAGYPVTLSGQLSLTFEPDRANLKVNPDAADPDRQLLSTDQFPNPGFAVPAGSSGFSVPLQPGLGAGTVTVRATNLTADNLDVTPASPPAVQIKINAAPPSITACALVESASTFQTRITGFSSTREVTTASFTLTAAPGSSLTTGTVPVPDASSVLFAPYYATNFGAFTFTQIFNVQGSSSAVGTVSVTLGNALGTTTKACLRGQ
jgi:hypothetical protein